jgi:hypothetical protein
LVDDYHNLSALGDTGGVTNLDALQAFIFGNSSGASGRPISMLSFLINDQYWPSTAFSFKYTNLMIHLLCGMLIIALCYRVLLALTADENRASYIAIVVAALWMLHPFNVSTTLYVIQRMAQLSTLFTLASIVLFCYGRPLIAQNTRKALILMTMGVAIFGLLAVLSKENGALLLVFIVIVESTIFHNLEKPNVLKYWFTLFIYLPLVLLALYFISNDFFSTTYDSRNFSLAERLLTENRILLDYLHSILIPHLFGNGLINDDITISNNLFSPITTFFAVLVNLTLVLLAIFFRKKQPVFSFSVLWFYGGHLLESTFLPLELYFEHRNYLPMIGPLFGLIYYVTELLKYIDKKSIQRVIASTPFILILFSAVLTHKSSMIWSNPDLLFKVWAYEHPDSLRAQRLYGQYLGNTNKPKLAVQTLASALKKFPYDISLALELINISCRYKVNTFYDLDDIQHLSQHAKFTDGTVPITKQLVDNIVTGQCASYNLDDAISIVSAINNITDIDSHHNQYAKLLFLQSDLYVLNHQLDPALKLLDQVYKYQKTTIVPIRQAELLISAGLYQEAIKYINIAKKADNNRRLLAPSKLPRILNLEQSVGRYINVDTQA